VNSEVYTGRKVVALKRLIYHITHDIVVGDRFGTNDFNVPEKVFY
jgi:hypothetical protein